MKLLMFRDGTDRRIGVMNDADPDQFLDVSALAASKGTRLPAADILGLIELGPEAMDRIRELLSSAGKGNAASRRLSEVTVLPPLDPPRGNILAIGRNYAKHAAESARAWGENVKPPTVFTKAQTSITGPFDDIVIDPRISDQIDWEVELGVVIGRRGVNIGKENARRHVFGYTVVNDVSARDIQNGWGGQFFKGKSLDRSSPVGPWIVTADELPDPQSLAVRLRVNGESKQDGNTVDMIYPVDELIAWLSKGMTLLPGNLIATGTPDGVGFARKPPQFLKEGDLMETEVEGVGTLRNRMVGAPVAKQASPLP
jgi:2-keto-4-pentenoate hydratase/2-oxohepta-3-ene-1,7-dioic acid hydratase in catechol pathway